MPQGMTRQPVASTTLLVFSVGSCAPMAATVSPLMPTSAREVSVAVTTVPLRITVSKRMLSLRENNEARCLQESPRFARRPSLHDQIAIGPPNREITYSGIRTSGYQL